MIRINELLIESESGGTHLLCIFDQKSDFV